jgi:hypothetical protein
MSVSKQLFRMGSRFSRAKSTGLTNSGGSRSENGAFLLATAPAEPCCANHCGKEGLLSLWISFFAFKSCYYAVVRSQVHLSPSVGHLAVTSTGTPSPLFPNRHYHTAGQSMDVDAKPKHALIDISAQMTQLALRLDHLKNGLAEMNQDLADIKKYGVRRDRFMHFSQVVAAFICDAILGPLKYPSSFFGKLASTAVSEENVAFRNQVQALGAPTGVTIELLLEWERFFDEDDPGCILPPITKAEFIEVANELIADKTLTASSVDVLEKVFDVVYSNQM